MTITSTETLTGCSSIFLWVQGELHFQSGKKLNLPCGSVVFVDGGPPPGSITACGGGGSSNYIRICGDTYWRVGDGDVTGPEIFCMGCTLPIELIAFNANPVNETVIINWITASESNNDYFILDHSTDGKNWNEISKTEGAGNSVSNLYYQYSHQQPLVGINYYRLTQVDFDGVRETFNVVSVQFGGNIVSIYPNPVQSGQFLNISVENEAIIKLFTASGSFISEHNFSKLSGVNKNILIDLTPGVYFVQVNFEMHKLLVGN